MRGVAVRPAGHDGVEGQSLRAAVGHLALQDDRELALGQAGPDSGHGGLECAGGDLAGSRQQGDLGVVLHHPQAFHQAAERDQRQAAAAAGQRLVALDGHLVLLERHRGPAAGGGQRGERGLGEPVDDQLQVRAVTLRRGRVARVRRQHGCTRARGPGAGGPGAGGASGRQQQCRVRAGEAGQVTDIDQIGDEGGAGAERGCLLLQPRPAGGMNSGHAHDCTAPPG